MKALVFNDVGDIELKDVHEPAIKDQTDAIIKITTTTICGTDLHMVRGTITGMKKGTILGHEGVGVVEKVGTHVKNFHVGDRVIVPSTIACGSCEYCQKELYSQCNASNPNGPDKGTAFYGGPEASGPFNGMQAEKVRVPYADTNLIKIPEGITDEQVILLSDILPTAYMGVEFAEVKPEDTVAVFGCGPVGQLVIACLKRLNPHKIIAIDRVSSRLKLAESQGATTINFEEHDPVKELKKLTNGKGPNKIIDAVGVDAQCPKSTDSEEKKEFKKEVKKIAPKKNVQGGNWVPGNGPSQVLRWAVEAIAKAGTISIIGVYSDESKMFEVGAAMEKNITVRSGNCNHRKYIPMLLEWVKDGSFKSSKFLTQKASFADIVHAYKKFDKRAANWVKVVLSV